MTFSIGLVVLTVSIFLIRALLIVLGIYKEPILRKLENYGDETAYSPMVDLVFWSAILLGIVLVFFSRSSQFNLLIFFLIFPAVWLYSRSDDYILRYPRFFLVYPRWYYKLFDRTDRDERRRIAYMWLWLPIRTRLLYNTHSRYFVRWVDLVLISVSRIQREDEFIDHYA